MITHADVAKWLRENADRQGTTEYDAALKAYKTLKAKSEMGQLSDPDFQRAMGTQPDQVQGMPATAVQFEERFGDITPQGTRT
jgi:hypothetical protein